MESVAITPQERPEIAVRTIVPRDSLPLTLALSAPAPDLRFADPACLAQEEEH